MDKRLKGLSEIITDLKIDTGEKISDLFVVETVNFLTYLPTS